MSPSHLARRRVSVGTLQEMPSQGVVEILVTEATIIELRQY
jgi:hypothetical protein